MLLLVGLCTGKYWYLYFDIRLIFASYLFLLRGFRLYCISIRDNDSVTFSQAE